MPIYLDEDMVGQDQAEICYPHLLLCMGVTVLMADGSLVGAHFTTPGTEAGVMAEMVRQIAAHPAAMHQLYCAADLPEHVVKYGGMNVRAKAQALGFHGTAYSFDSSSIKPQDGTFVAIRSNGPNNPCGIYYKRDEKVRPLYETVGAPPLVSKVSGYKGTQIGVPASKTGLSAPINKLHKANFLLQVKRYSIP